MCPKAHWPIVLLEPSPAVSEGAAAVAVDVDTRNMSPENAGRALADTIRACTTRARG